MDRIFIPLMPGTKRPIREATRWQAEDADTAAWWAVAPEDANTALRLDGLLVVDCDNEESNAWWLAQGVEAEAIVKTPHGWHYYFELDAGTEAPKGGPLKLPDGEPRHVDIKSGRKHYVLIPPSILEDGARYEWVLRGDGT